MLKLVIALENRKIPLVPPEHIGRLSSKDFSSCSALDANLPGSKRHSHALSQVNKNLKVEIQVETLLMLSFSSGVENGNLRELALARMKEFGIECRDVRTREVGIQEVHHKVRPYQVILFILELHQLAKLIV